MDSLVKVEDFEFSSDSPIYDFSAGFESIPLAYMPDSDGNSLYGFGTSPPSSLASSSSHNMAVDLNYPPPPQLSNNHRQPRFLNRAGWPVGDSAQRPSISPAARPYGATNLYGSSYERLSEGGDMVKQEAPDSLEYPRTAYRAQKMANRSSMPSMEVSSSSMEVVSGSSSSTSVLKEERVGAMGRSGEGEGVSLLIDTHPPVEVRTRTPSEKRNFSCAIQIQGDYKMMGGKFVSVELMYSPNAQRAPGEDEVPKQTILGGTKVVMIKANGSAVFDNLSMSEASTKHKEKEFCLKFTLVDKTGAKLPVQARSTSFYAFSNTKVLARRRDISLRTLSKTFGVFQGGETMHVIGAPFIRGPALKLIFRTPHGDAIATNLELYSETVLFFTLPAYPGLMPGETEPLEAKAQVLVTNDGRNFSNPLDFLYVSSRRSTMRSYL